MHLIRASLTLALLAVLNNAALAQTPAQQPAPAAPAQPAAPAAAPPSPPPTAAPQQRRAAPAATIGLPNPTPIAEIPRGQVVLLAGVLSSPQPRTFVLNDGNASIVVNLGPTWQDLTKLKAGDRLRVLGQLDPYGAPVFRAGSVVLDNGRIIVVPN
jgi:glucose/arabinose dehydrogenase